MSMKKSSNQSSGPRFIKESTQQKSRSEHNQSFDTSYNQKSASYAPSFVNQSRLKSYSQQANILDELEEETTYPKTINVAIQKKSTQSEDILQQELQKMLNKTINGDRLNVDDFTTIINVIGQCMQESAISIKQKDFEVQCNVNQIHTLRQSYENQLHQQQSIILSLENEVQELRHMITLQPNESSNMRIQQLEQENEMLKLQNQYSIKLAVQGRNKKQEKELGELVNKIKTSNQKAQVNNYSILLNQQYNKIYSQQEKRNKSQLF